MAVSDASRVADDRIALAIVLSGTDACGAADLVPRLETRGIGV
jgi:hypothetical protein